MVTFLYNYLLLASKQENMADMVECHSCDCLGYSKTHLASRLTLKCLSHPDFEKASCHTSCNFKEVNSANRLSEFVSFHSQASRGECSLGDTLQKPSTT
jgi:hypothetical protein